MWGYYVLRLSSFIVTFFVLKLKVSANKVSYISLFIGLTGTLFLSIGLYFLSLLGVLLLNIWALLDYVDGNIARFNKSSSNHGQFIDSLSGALIGIFLFISLGLGIYNSSNNSTIYVLGLEVEGVFFIILGITTSLFLIFIEWISCIFGQIYHTTKKQFFGSDYSPLFKIYYNLVNISGLIMPLLIIFAILNYLNIFLILFFILYSISCLGSSVYLIIHSKSS